MVQLRLVAEVAKAPKIPTYLEWILISHGYVKKYKYFGYCYLLLSKMYWYMILFLKKKILFKKKKKMFKMYKPILKIISVEKNISFLFQRK
jgi:hypothetical protein